MSSTESPDRQTPEIGLSNGWVILIVGFCIVCFLALLIVPALAKLREPSKYPATPNSMKLFGLVFKMYANESEGERWPALAPNDAVWAPDISKLYPEYMSDPGIMVSSEHPNSDSLHKTIHHVLKYPNPDHQTAAGLMGLSFAYLGHAVKDEAGFAALVEARNRGLLDGSGKNFRVRDLDAWIFPLREGVERFLITDINGGLAFVQLEAIRSNIPVMVEIAGWKHKRSEETPRGAHVLYMGGHVEFVKLGTFPVLAEVMDVLSGLAEGFNPPR